MKQFIGREMEMAVLEREHKRESGFVVLYGRRRVGKTTLIKEFVRDKAALYFLATEEMETGNMRRFTTTLAAFVEQPYLKDTVFSDWEALFSAFAAYRPNQKKVLVIDEFQYLVSANAAFASIFQRVWDEVLKDHNIMVILCGSLISMMTSQVLSYSSPLYGRRTAQIRLAPLRFMEMWKFRGNRTFEQMVALYAVTGGVPKYLEFFDNELSLMENIEREALSKGGFLYEEPVFLLEREVQDIASYFSIMKTIAMGHHKVSQVAALLGVSSNSLSPYLRTLMALQLLEKRIPVTEKQPEKSRKGLYHVRDHFIAFWFRFVHAYQGELEMENTAYVLDKLNTSFIDTHVSFVYEEVCRDMLASLCREGLFSFTPGKVGSYWNANTEIDVVALDEVNRRVLLGECKYLMKPVDADVLFTLKKKGIDAPDFEGYEKEYVIFSKSGFTKRLKTVAMKAPDVHLIHQDRVIATT